MSNSYRPSIPVTAALFGIGIALAVVFGLLHYIEAEREKELAALTAEVSADNEKYAGMDATVRDAFKSWERTTGSGDETRVWRGASAKVLWVKYRPASVREGEHNYKRPAYWEVMAQTPNGRLFRVTFNPYEKTFYGFNHVGRDEVIQQSINDGQPIDESQFLPHEGKEA